MTGTEWIQRTSSDIDVFLDRVLPAEDTEPSALHSAMRYSVFPGGKRLRPALAVAACSAASRGEGEPQDGVMWPAAAVELVHCYSLIHDDLPCMDDDDIRRGKPSCHVAYGEATALLAGDALLTLAFGTLSDPTFVRRVGAEVACACSQELSLASGSVGMVGGQALDIAAPPADRAQAGETMVRMERLKTGRLIECAVRMGALVGGADRDDFDRMTDFARHFGQAFQIRDDLEDADDQDAQAGRLTSVSVWGRGGAGARLMALVSSARECIAPLGRRGAELSFLAELLF